MNHGFYLIFAIIFPLKGFLHAKWVLCSHWGYGDTI